jgi:hypothetical protein
MSDPYDYEFVNVNSIANNVNGFASNESGTRRQYAWASPREAAAATQSQFPSLIGPVPVPGYTEKGQFNWRAQNDQAFIDAANNYNRSYGLRSDDPGYITPQLLKAWAIIENGDNKEKFLRDPFTANNPGDWDDAKTKIAGLQRGEAMTPEKSARAALDWMRYKSVWKDGKTTGGKGTLEEGLRNYSGVSNMHDTPDRKKYYDYHPGAFHREWYTAAILGLEAKMLGMVRPQMD